jgi:hypothetical protein
VIDHTVFYDRLSQCKMCEFFAGRRCRKGHGLASPNGCPIQKFPPMAGCGYDMDQEPDTPFIPTCPSCVVDKSMPEMTWPQVIQHFTAAMIRWAAAGMPLVSEEVHTERIQTCFTCLRRKGKWCSICHCLLYLKAKVGTESCPESRWWR